MSSSGSQPTIFGMFQKQEAKLVRMDSGERAELGAKVKGKADSAQHSADTASTIGAPPCGPLGDEFFGAPAFRQLRGAIYFPSADFGPIILISKFNCLVCNNTHTHSRES